MDIQFKSRVLRRRIDTQWQVEVMDDTVWAQAADDQIVVQRVSDFEDRSTCLASPKVDVHGLDARFDLKLVDSLLNMDVDRVGQSEHVLLPGLDNILRHQSFGAVRAQLERVFTSEMHVQHLVARADRRIRFVRRIEAYKVLLVDGHAQAPQPRTHREDVPGDPDPRGLGKGERNDRYRTFRIRSEEGHVWAPVRWTRSVCIALRGRDQTADYNSTLWGTKAAPGRRMMRTHEAGRRSSHDFIAVDDGAPAPHCAERGGDRARQPLRGRVEPGAQDRAERESGNSAGDDHRVGNRIDNGQCRQVGHWQRDDRRHGGHGRAYPRRGRRHQRADHHSVWSRRRTMSGRCRPAPGSATPSTRATRRAISISTSTARRIAAAKSAARSSR